MLTIYEIERTTPTGTEQSLVKAAREAKAHLK